MEIGFSSGTLFADINTSEETVPMPKSAEQENKSSNQQNDDPVSAEERILENNEDPAPWRPADAAEKQEITTKSAAAGASKTDSETGDPGRTPGSAEGVEDFQKTGNE